jgi:hypothetical protein
MALQTVNVEIDGKVVQRLRVHRVLWCEGKGAVACTQPQLWPGEKLVERPGKIAAIVREMPCAPGS